MDPPCPTFRSESDEESPLDPLVAVFFQISHTLLFLSAAIVVTLPS